jgi:hypothetical protein
MLICARIQDNAETLSAMTKNSDFMHTMQLALKSDDPYIHELALTIVSSSGHGPLIQLLQCNDGAVRLNILEQLAFGVQKHGVLDGDVDMWHVVAATVLADVPTYIEQCVSGTVHLSLS